MPSQSHSETFSWPGGCITLPEHLVSSTALLEGRVWFGLLRVRACVAFRRPNEVREEESPALFASGFSHDRNDSDGSGRPAPDGYGLLPHDQ